ncbi:MAG: hypothetical protein IH948_10070 [Bacteroidetes bacterium]|nr:hypothetical protein [Bacteroidota bacterium]
MKMQYGFKRSITPIVCENASTTGNRIGIAQCYNNLAENKVIIQYSDHEIDVDILYFCKECAGRVKKDAEGHGYKVMIKENI